MPLSHPFPLNVFGYHEQPFGAAVGFADWARLRQVRGTVATVEAEMNTGSDRRERSGTGLGRVAARFGCRGLCIALLAGALLSGFVLNARAQTERVEGTAYDRLDLSSPDAALRAFLSAFRRGDYVTAYWIFSPQSQLDWDSLIYRLNLGQTVRAAQPLGGGFVEQAIPPLAQWEQQDMSFLFAHVMNAAKRIDALPIDLAGLPDDLSANGLALGAAAPAGDGSVVIAVALKAYAAPVIFRLVTSPLGKWRLRQIVPPGGDPNSLPFGLR